MGSSPAGAIGCLGIFLSVPSIIAIFVLSIYGIILGARGPYVCDTATVLSIPTWLIVSGSIYMGYLAVVTIVVAMDVAQMAWLFAYVPFGLWALSWNIIGWIILFRDSTCVGLEVGNVTVASLVFQLFFVTPIYWLSIGLVN